MYYILLSIIFIYYIVAYVAWIKIHNIRVHVCTTHTHTHILYTIVVKHASYTLTHAHTNSCTRTYGWCVYYICIILSEEQQQAHGRRYPSRNASTHYARAGQ